MLILARRLAGAGLGAPSRNLTQTAESALVTTSYLGGGVAQLTLNDPDRLNALTVAMGEQFAAQVDELTAKARTGEVRNSMQFWPANNSKELSLAKSVPATVDAQLHILHVDPCLSRVRCR
jgi:hypothetical protein